MKAIWIVVTWLLGSSAEAHVKWFYQGERPPAQWDALLNPITLAVIGGVAALVTALAAVQRFRGGQGVIPTMRWFGASDDHRAALFSFIPAILAVHFAVPLFVLLVAAEMLWARRRAPEKYEPRDTLTSLAFGVGSTVAGLLLGGLIVAISLWVWQFRLITLPWTWWAWIAAFVLDDLAYYCFHRSAHRVRWFWASHVNHHSSQHYNLSTALFRPGPDSLPCRSCSACRCCWRVFIPQCWPLWGVST